MRLLQSIILTAIIFCCTPTKEKYLFDDLTDKETVLIILSKYNLDSVPCEIGRLTKAKRLYIALDSGGWTVYPSLSALPQAMDSSPSQKLPDEITELTNLKSLGLIHLSLESLPTDFGKLENLDSLDLSMNRLTISNELEKLKSLKGLKYLGLMGNAVDRTDIKELKRNNPNLTISVWGE